MLIHCYPASSSAAIAETRCTMYAVRIGITAKNTSPVLRIESSAAAATSHQIKAEVIEQIVLAQLQSIIRFASDHEAEFTEMVMQRSQKARIAELDTFFAKDQEQAVNLKTFMQHVKQYTHLDHLDAEILRIFIKRIVVTDTMPGKQGKGIEIKLEYTIDGEYKTYPEQQNGKTA